MSAIAEPRESVSRRSVWWGLGALLLTGAGSFIWWEARSEERDRHALLAHVREIEGLIRRHDSALWTRVEREHGPRRPIPAADAEHQAMLRDFERLSHLDDFSMTDVEVQLQGDVAKVSYRIEGRPAAPSGVGRRDAAETVPKGGELSFVRAPSGWDVARHRFTE